jgi:hypothetical protein
MVDTQGPSSTTLLDQLANLDPQERREVATIVRGLSETFAEVPDGKTRLQYLRWINYLWSNRGRPSSR